MGGGFSRDLPEPDTQKMRRLIEKIKEDQASRAAEGDINDLLQKTLAGFNDRDTEKTQERIDALRDALGEEYGFINILFGGSVAKHTYVDGISDVDGLVVLKSDAGKESKELIKSFEKILKDVIGHKVKDISSGNMAVTIRYKDGQEIQLLPSVKVSKEMISVPRPGGGWTRVNPGKFMAELTKANKDNDGRLVPAIKLYKSINTSLPENLRLSGYHIEAMCVKAVEGYEGPKTYKSLLLHIAEKTPDLMRRPIRDSTGQSQYIDDNFGPANSEKRQRVANALIGIYKRLRNAQTASEWRDVVEGD